MAAPVAGPVVRWPSPGVGIRLLAVLLCLLLVGGCATTPRQANPLERATDPTLSTSARLNAIAGLSDGQAFELFVLVTHARHPIAVRRAAVGRMLAIDPDRFWRSAAQRAALIDDWPMIRLLSERAETRREEAALTWLTRSWSAPSVTIDDEQRPERRAIRAVTGEPAEQLLRRSVFEPEADAAILVRAAAWTVLMRVRGADQLRLEVSGRPPQPDDPLIDALRWCVDSSVKLPADREEIGRLLTVVSQQSFEDQRLHRWAITHRDDPAGPLALRHIPAAMIAPADRRGWGRADWHDDIGRRLEGRSHASRGTGAGDEIVNTSPDRLTDHADHLSVGDYIVLDALIRALDDRRVVAALFRQADTDLADNTTEHGGVLVIDAGNQATAQSFEPLLRQHDRIYFASDACVRAMHTGLAHYHFHAQRHDNAVWAGPGKGDLGFANRLHANCVVFTFIDRNTLNADAYFPGGVIVDLGCITR